MDKDQQWRALQKVDQLIRKGLSTYSAEEARTCAMAAIQIIKKYELQIGLTSQTIPPPERAEPAPRPRRSWGHTQSGKRKPVTRWIHTEYPATCLICFRQIEPGDYVFWEKRVGCTCAECKRSK